MNVDYATRSKIDEKFNMNVGNSSLKPNKSNFCTDEQFGIKFDPLPTNHTDMVIVIRKYAHLFDEALNVIRVTIDTDIWPRFRKTQTYNDVIRKHQITLKNIRSNSIV